MKAAGVAGAGNCPAIPLECASPYWRFPNFSDMKTATPL